MPTSPWKLIMGPVVMVAILGVCFVIDYTTIHSTHRRLKSQQEFENAYKSSSSEWIKLLKDINQHFHNETVLSRPAPCQFHPRGECHCAAMLGDWKNMKLM